jgi:hypothetical protein
MTLSISMQESARTCVSVVLAVSILVFLGCTYGNTDGKANPVVGAWLVKDSGAPFPYHMYVFNADGTMQQANPDAGDPRTSDSDGKGVWANDGDGIKGKWMEVVADRATHQFAGRTEISYEIKVNGDTFTGTETARFYDAGGTPTEGPIRPMPLEGKRVSPP